MKSLPALFFVAMFGVACRQEKPQQPAATAPAPEAVMPQSRDVCYEWREGKTVAVAALTFAGDSVSGRLNYLFAEKDQSHGYIQGTVQKDIVKADYTYRSEGVVSVMEIIFRVQGDKLVQGHGPMRMQGNKLVYAFPDKLSFSTPFQAVPCLAKK